MNITAIEPILLFLNINAGLLTLMKERNCETVKRMTFSPLPAQKEMFFINIGFGNSVTSSASAAMVLQPLPPLALLLRILTHK